jgi:hypothetical protein
MTRPILRLTYFVVAIALVAQPTAASCAGYRQAARGLPEVLMMPACLATDDFANEYRDYVLEVDTGTDVESVRLREGWNIPAVQPSEIAFVSDSATCAAAAVAHAVKVQEDTVNPPSVWVLRVGTTRYIVFNGHRAGEFLVYFVFDTAFQYLETI